MSPLIHKNAAVHYYSKLNSVFFFRYGTKFLYEFEAFLVYS